MSINVQLQPLSPSVAGRARLVIKKWTGSSAGLEFSIQRNQDMAYLQETNEWKISPKWFSPSFTVNDEGGLECILGKEILDPLLESSGSATYRFTLQDGANQSDAGPVRLLPGLLASGAEGQTESSRETATLVSPPEPVAPVVEPEQPEPPAEAEHTEQPAAAPEPETVADPAPVSSEPTVRKKRNPLWIALPVVALLGAVALGAWFWMKPVNASASAAVPSATAQAAVQAPDTSCSMNGINNMAELEFVQTCIQQDLDSARLLEVIAGAKAAGKCGVAQRLYANRAQGGDVEIALAYAREYDPQYHKANPCFAEPHKETASYWYETVLAVDPEHAQAKQRLGELTL